MTKWLGETNCNFCHRDITTLAETILIDGKTKYGPWAVMCNKCFAKQGVGLGIGLGQAHSLNDKGAFVRIAGGSKR